VGDGDRLPDRGESPVLYATESAAARAGVDDFAEAQCAAFYADTTGRPSPPPGIYLRLLVIGYFEGIDSERGIAWRAVDSFALRDCLGIGLEDAPPDHSTISRTRLIDLETHRAVFTWVLQCLSTAGLAKGKTIGIDATTLEANAALRSIVRRDSGESYEEFLTTLEGLWHSNAHACRFGADRSPTQEEKARMTTGRIRTIPTPRSRG
jgi:transposase